MDEIELAAYVDKLEADSDPTMTELVFSSEITEIDAILINVECERRGVDVRIEAMGAEELQEMAMKVARRMMERDFDEDDEWVDDDD